MNAISVIFLIVLLACLFGCNASISRHGYSVNDLQTTFEPCTDIIIKHKASFPEDVASVVGAIEAGDSGFSTACSEAYVLNVFRKDACALKANIINILEETQPNFWSTCYRAKADLLRCKDKNILANIKTDPQYASDSVNERSKKTAIMNAAAIGAIGGVIGGALGGGIATAAVASAGSSDQNVAQWRPPLPADLGDNTEWRKENADSFLTVNADFDGDGKIDTAKILIYDKENKMGLFVTLASQKSSALLQTTDKEELRSMGIKVAKPGQYKTACGKGYWTCKKDEPEILELEQPAIDFFTYEGANSYFVWDKMAKSFKRIWMSD